MRRGEPGAEVAHEVPVARVVLRWVGCPGQAAVGQTPGASKLTENDFTQIRDLRRV
jgi:hypothetical protein